VTRALQRIGVALLVAVAALAPACKASGYPQMFCSGEQRQNMLHLAAQAVPSATIIACIERLTPGWSYGGSEIRSGLVHFWLDSDRAGPDAVDVRMTAACQVPAGLAAPLPRDPALSLYEEPTAEGSSSTIRYYLFAGGCATVRFSFTRTTAPSMFRDAQRLLGSDQRSDFVAGVRAETGLALCGAGAPPCPG
jgi:hypothetical protein